MARLVLLHAILLCVCLCTCSTSQYGSLKYLTWYNAPGDDDWIAQTHSNLQTNENLDQMMGNDTATPYFMLDMHRPGPRSQCWWVQPKQWDQPGGGLRPGWEADMEWELEKAMPHIIAKKIVGIFLGDEPASNGVPVANITTVANFVKAKLFNTTAFLYVNEASQAFNPGILKSHPHFQGHYTSLPNALDIISLDGYCMGNIGDPVCPLAAEATMMRQFYQTLIYPLLRPHQRVAVVPGFFGNCTAQSNTQCLNGVNDCRADASTGWRQVCPEQDEANLAKLNGYLHWIRADPLIVMMNPWHYYNLCDNLGHNCLRGEAALGAQAFPRLLAKIRAMADAINHTERPPSLKMDDATASSIVRVFPHRANPWTNPHSARHFVGPPPRSFGNKTQFVSYRGEPWGGTTSNMLNAIQALGIGKAIYPELPFIWQQNVTAVLRDIRHRGMFLVNLNSYFMGAATDCRTRYPQGGGVCQFRVSSEDMQMLEETMGDHFAGFEIGEKDGGMLGNAAGHTVHGSTGFGHSRSAQLDASASARRYEWLRFRHTFERMGEDLGFQLSALVSAYFPHYLAKSGYYMMIGAETAEMLPNDQIFYSFVRGAAKQYATLTYGMASVWNHYAGKQCHTASACTETGSSLSLLRRLMVTEILYGSSWFAFECCMYVTPPANATDHELVLTPLGLISRSGKELVDDLPVLGSVLTTVGVVLDFFTGFAPPRTAYADYTQGYTYWNAGDTWRAWGPLPADSGDYFTAAVLNVTYPGWVNSQYFQDERGFLSPTPFGDIVDVLLSDAPAALFGQYHMLVVTTTIRTMKSELRYKLEQYVRGGGAIVVTAEGIESMGGLFGTRASGEYEEIATIHAGSTVHVLSAVLPGLPDTVAEPNEFVSWTIDRRLAEDDVSIDVAATVIQSSGVVPLIYRVRVGSGTAWILASNGVATQSFVLPNLVNEMDKSLGNPRPILVHVQLALASWFRSIAPFSAGQDLSVVTTAIDDLPNEYVVGVGNPLLRQIDLNVSSRLGRITKIEEVPVGANSNVGPDTPGWFPTGYNGSDIGKSTSNTIAGLDQRVFRIAVDGTNTRFLPKQTSSPLPSRRALPLLINGDIAGTVSSQPSFFDHWDTIVVDWRWVLNQDADALAKDSQWALRQKLSIIVDFTSGLNGWPDLRLWNNSQTELTKSIDTVTAVLRKMGTLQNASVAGKRTGVFSRHGIISLHAYPPTEEIESTTEAHVDMINAVAKLVNIAHDFKVTLHLRVGATTSSQYTRPPITVQSALMFVQNVSNQVSILRSDHPVHDNAATDPKLMLLVSAAQLAVQGYNASTLPKQLIPHIGGWEFASPVFDVYGGALVSVHGPLAARDANWSAPHRHEATECVLAPNMTWRTMPFGKNSGAAVAREPADCCALCRAHSTCGVATWSGVDGVCYMAQGLVTRMVPIDACNTPSTEFAPGVDVVHACPWKPPLRGTVAVRPVRPASYYRVAIRDLARLARPAGKRLASTFVIAGGIEMMANPNVHMDASFLEAQVMAKLGL